MKREELPAAAQRALPPEEQKRFLRVVERSPSARDRAVATLFFYSALRLEELAALDADDVAISARKGRVTVRSGKGDRYREVALNAKVRGALDGWLSERRARFGDEGLALFVGREGRRLTTRAVDLIVRRLGEEANLEAPLSAHVLNASSILSADASNNCCVSLVSLNFREDLVPDDLREATYLHANQRA